MGRSPPGSSVHENFPARILEWVAASFSRGSEVCAVREEYTGLESTVLSSVAAGMDYMPVSKLLQ